MTGVTPPVMSPTEANALLAASPVTVQPSATGASGMTSWVPPRQVIVGGASAIIAWLIIHALAAAGLDIAAVVTVDPGHALVLAFGLDPTTVAGQVQGWLSGLIGLAIATYVPPSYADIIKNLNDKIIHIAQRDPATNVSYVLTPVTPRAGDPPTIIPPATKE